MKQNTKIDYTEEEGQDEIVNMNAFELSELIENRINVPGRKSKQTIKEINHMIEHYNMSYGKGTYKKL